MEEEKHKIIIKVDEYLDLTIKIPKVMTPIEFKALTSKANKLFNLSDVQIMDRPQPTIKRSYIKKSDYDEDVLLREYNECETTNDRNALAQKYGIKATILHQRIFGIRKKNGINPKLNGVLPSFTKKGYQWTDEEVKELVRLRKTHSIGEIAKKFNLKWYQIRDKLKTKVAIAEAKKI